MLIVLTALALSMDAFSLAIIYGINQIRLKQAIILSVLVGINHFLFPILGNMLSNFLFSDFFNFKIITLIVFTILGIEMLVGDEKSDDNVLDFIGIILFAIGVSIDSFVIGITIKEQILIPALTFLLFSSSFTFIGLKLGQKIGVKFGKTSKKVGGIVLIIIGLYSAIF